MAPIEPLQVMSETKPSGAGPPLKAPTGANEAAAVGDGTSDGASDGASDGLPAGPGGSVGVSVAVKVGASVSGLAELGDDEQALTSTTSVSASDDARFPLISTA